MKNAAAILDYLKMPKSAILAFSGFGFSDPKTTRNSSKKNLIPQNKVGNF
jgi:hypothetical protein